jgi:hypothetical protein
VTNIIGGGGSLLFAGLHSQKTILKVKSAKIKCFLRFSIAVRKKNHLSPGRWRKTGDDP